MQRMADALRNPPLLWLAAGLWLLVLPGLVRWVLVRLRLVRPNFLGERIPVGFGLVILLWAAPLLAVLALLRPETRHETAAALLLVAGLGLLGFLDDWLGDRSVTGLKGHFRKAILDGEITTGFLKAAVGWLLSVLVVRFVLERSLPVALLDGTLIALSANAMNLFDLRPGRAGALFLVCAVLLLTISYTGSHSFVLTPLLFVLIPALLVYERDARGQVMLGDTGSNLLGGVLGLSFCWQFPALLVHGILLALLIVLHLLAERVSISALIERHPVLRRLDALTGKRRR